MTDQELTPPPGAIDAAERAATLGQGSTEPLSLAGIEVYEALTGARPLTHQHVAAMAAHPYPVDSLCGLLFGGVDGRRWALAVTAAAEPAPEVVLPDLAALSAKLTSIDRRFRDRVEQVLAQAMRTALRRADVKVKVRSRSRVVTAAALAPHLDAMAARAYPPALLASLRTTHDELLHDSFTDAADQVTLLFGRRQRDRRAALARYLDVDRDELDREWSQEEERRGAAIGTFVLGAMFAEAAARLSQPRDEPVFDRRGAQPVDPFVSPRITGDVARLADGATLAPPAPGQEVPAAITPPSPGTAGGTGGTDQAPLFDYTDHLLTDLIAERTPAAVQVVYTWTVGDPAVPFEPHQELAGMTATDDTYWTVFAKDPSEFPEGEMAWFPQDHPGCQCDLSVEYVAVEDSPDN